MTFTSTHREESRRREDDTINAAKSAQRYKYGNQPTQWTENFIAKSLMQYGMQFCEQVATF